MNKQELVGELAEKLDISQKSCRQALDVLQEEIISILEEGGQYKPTGFGSFKTFISSERISFHPVIKKRMRLPKKRKLRFRASMKLKEQINE